MPELGQLDMRLLYASAEAEPIRKYSLGGNRAINLSVLQLSSALQSFRIPIILPERILESH